MMSRWPHPLDPEPSPRQRAWWRIEAWIIAALAIVAVVAATGADGRRKREAKRVRPVAVRTLASSTGGYRNCAEARAAGGGRRYGGDRRGTAGGWTATATGSGAKHDDAARSNLMAMPIDPRAIARRALSRAEEAVLIAVVGATSSLAAQASGAFRGSFDRMLTTVTDALAKLPHATANAILDKDRGPQARPLTADEARLVTDAFGQRVPPNQVRIVPGAGLSLFAKMAFANGNPAITLGNTIYLKRGQADLTASDSGIELLLHEYTHVIQYASLGFGVFGRRYAAELKTNGFDADKLYDYRSRRRHWQGETLEGQDQIVGEYTLFLRQKCTPQSLRTLAMLRGKLKGTGIYGL